MGARQEHQEHATQSADPGGYMFCPRHPRITIRKAIWKGLYD